MISLTTDFGFEDWFVGTMKAVILKIHPSVQLIDVTHRIPAGDIFAGALALSLAYRYFPKGTIHIAVVDPGVGSARKPIAVQTEDFVFVGPDNGLLSLALAREQPLHGIVHLENPCYFLDPVSQTFHGRDVFAPVGAHLSKGVPLKEFGPAVDSYKKIDFPEPEFRSGAIYGQIIYLDRFGNALSNVEEKHLDYLRDAELVVTLAKVEQPIPFKRFYGAVLKGSPVALIASSGFLEVALHNANAARQLRIEPGDSIVVSSQKSQVR